VESEENMRVNARRVWRLHYAEEPAGTLSRKQHTPVAGPTPARPNYLSPGKGFQT